MDDQNLLEDNFFQEYGINKEVNFKYFQFKKIIKFHYN